MSTKSPSFCKTTLSASLTNLTPRLPQSRDCSCYINRQILAPPHWSARTRLRALPRLVISAKARWCYLRLKLETLWNYSCYTGRTNFRSSYGYNVCAVDGRDFRKVGSSGDPWPVTCSTTRFVLINFVETSPLFLTTLTETWTWLYHKRVFNERDKAGKRTWWWI